MTSLTSSTGGSGALMEMSGTVPTNSTWYEDIYFTEAGAAMDLTGLTFKMTFRESPDDTTAAITLSTSNYLSIVEDTDAGVDRILRINVPDGTFNSYTGDFIADLASEDGNGVVTLWAHGIVTLVTNPVAF